MGLHPCVCSCSLPHFPGSQPSDNFRTLLLSEFPLLISLAPSSHFPLLVPLLPIQAHRPHPTAISAVKCLWSAHHSKATSQFAVCNSWKDWGPVNNRAPNVVEMTISVHLRLYKHIVHGLRSPFARYQTPDDVQIESARLLSLVTLSTSKAAAQFKPQPGFSSGSHPKKDGS